MSKSRRFSYALTVWNPVWFFDCPNRAYDVKRRMSSGGLPVKA
nr:MAG TPA: hypothetical protein [Caudoviricetes sp.]